MTDHFASLNATALLTTLLPSTTYTLIYTLPLLLSSLCLNFAGAFLTLDRSCSFPPNYDSVPGDFFPQERTSKLYWLLESGIGGLAAGYLFGVHLSTFLSLLIPSLSSSAPLSPKSFLSVWLLSALAATIPSGRWRYCAFAASGIAGGSTFALALAVILHPPLLTRTILTAIILPTQTILTILPLPRYRHMFLRLSLSATGAFGIVLSISLFAGVESWANVWERFWVANGQWGSSSERVLSATYCFLLVGGTGCDWMLRRKFGENPDQKWDSYLTTFSQNLPDRAGTFQPLTPIWSRPFRLGRHATPPTPHAVVFPADENLKSQISTPLKQKNPISISQLTGGFESQPYLKKKGCLRRQAEKTRDPVKFGGELFSSGSDSDEDKLRTPPGFGRSLLDMRRSSSPPVSVGFMRSLSKMTHANIKELTKVKMETRAHHDESLGYSDFDEDDVTSAAAMQRNRDVPGRSPDFLRRYSETGGSSTTSQRTAVEKPSPAISSVSAPEGAVPMTPSLIKAIDRIAVAQQAGYSAAGKPLRPCLPSSKSSNPAWLLGPQVSPSSPLSADEHKSAIWDAFWTDVGQKARHAQ